MSMHGRRGAQRGLALLEAISATVVAGTLAATALPRLVELSEDARATTLRGVAAAATATMYANRGACLVAASGRAAVHCQPLHDCTDVAVLMVGGLPAGYGIMAQALPAGGIETRCMLTDSESGRSIGFSGFGGG